METKKKEDRKLLGSQIEDRILEYIEKKPLAVGDRLPNEFELVRGGAKYDPRGGEGLGDKRSPSGEKRRRNLCAKPDTGRG